MANVETIQTQTW